MTGTRQIIQLTTKPIAVANTDWLAINTVGAVAYKISVTQLETYFTTKYVRLDGSTMTGFLLLNADPAQALGAATKQYVDSQVVVGNSNLTVFVATTANLSATYDNGTLGVGRTLTNNGALAALTVDDEAVAVGKRVLIKDQTLSFENGIYVVTVAGSGSTAWILTGFSLYDTAAEMKKGIEITATDGTLNAKTQWLQTTEVVTVGTDPVSYESNVVAGAGITKTNNILSLTNFPSVVGPVNSILISNGTAYISSTSLWPNTVGTLGKIIISDGTSNIYSTPSYPNAAGTAGKIIVSDGTNFITSTPTFPVSAGALGSIVISDGTNKINSTSLWVNTVGSAGTILRSNGTTNIYSTSTFADTYALNNILYANVANQIVGLATAASGVLITDSSTGIPSISQTLPTAVQNNITLLGTIAEDVNITRAQPAGTVSFTILNSSTTAGSKAVSSLLINNSTNEQAYWLVGHNAGQQYVFGYDGDTGNAFVFSVGATLASSNVYTINSSGVFAFENSVTFKATTNQIVLGTTNTTTISATAPASSSVYTIPDVGTTANFILSAGTQTIGGVKTLTGNNIYSGTSTFSNATVSQTLSSAGSAVTLTVENTDNSNAGSDAVMKVAVGGINGGDAYHLFSRPSATSYTMGVNNADGAFVLSVGTTLGTGNAIHCDTSGRINYPTQPHFLAYKSSSTTNATGDGTSLTIVQDTEVYDISSWFDNSTGIATAPITGKYYFGAAIYYAALGALHTSNGADFVVNSTSYNITSGNPGIVRDSGNSFICGTVKSFNLTAGDTIKISTSVSGSTKTVSNGGNSARSNSFWGMLAA